jgi:HAMP domain-containing protein
VFRKLNLRSKLLLASAYPLVAILVLAAIGFTTFQTVKVNGPQYQLIAAAKDLEADILPPPAYLVEAHLLATLLPKANSAAEFETIVSSMKARETEFEERHSFWQSSLGNRELLDSMRSAFVEGRRYFTVLNTEFVPAARIAFEQRTASDVANLNQIFDQKLAPVYKTHRSFIDTTVRRSLTRQTALEASTRAKVNDRLKLLGVFAIATLVSSALLALFSARSISRPISELTREAIDTAERDLPSAVAKIQSDDSSPEDLPTLPASEFVRDRTEIGDLARALDSMRSTAVSLAAEQALIRRNVSDNLVNVARRNQLLLKRTLGSITSMEREERNPATLERLFQLDHLTTRMRRNAESLLVLAGSDSPKLWTTPMVVGDVVRSAIAQIEAYDRVEFGYLDQAQIKGQAVTDVSHLLAEFLENATYFSPPTSKVTVTGRQRLDGYTIVISDDGVGMTPEGLQTANSKLSSPTTFYKEPTKVLGLTVAGHLAIRHQINVVMLPSLSQGVAVQIHLPTSLLQDVDLIESNPPTGRGVQPSGAQNTHVAAPSPALMTPAVAPVLRPPQMSQPVSGAQPQASSVIPEVLPQPVISGSGGELVKRVRGANLVDSGPAASDAPSRDAAHVRSALSSLQRGVRAAETASHGVPATPSRAPMSSGTPATPATSATPATATPRPETTP